MESFARYINSRGVAAFTLIETLIAMTIIVGVSGTGLLIFNQVTLHSVRTEQLRASLLLRSWGDSLLFTRSFQDRVRQEGGLTLQEKITPCVAAPEVEVLDLRAYDVTNHLLAEQKRLVLLDSLTSETASPIQMPVR